MRGIYHSTLYSFISQHVRGLCHPHRTTCENTPHSKEQKLGNCTSLRGHNPVGTVGQARTCPSEEELKLRVGLVERDWGDGQDLAVG